MASKLAMLCLLLAVGCTSMVSARTLSQATATAPPGCVCTIKAKMGGTGGAPCTAVPFDSRTNPHDIVLACVEIGGTVQANIVAAIVAALQLCLDVSIELCVNFIKELITCVGLKLSANLTLKVIALALIKLCVLVKADLVANLFVALGVKVWVDLFVALYAEVGAGATVCGDLLVELLKLIVKVTVNVQLYVNLLVGIFVGLCGPPTSAAIWVSICAQACIKVGVAGCKLLLLALNVQALAILKLILKVCGDLKAYEFLCHCYGIGIVVVLDILNIIGLGLGVCIKLGIILIVG